MSILLLAVTAVIGASALETVTLTWKISGVETTKSGEITDCPVTFVDGSAAGSWVINAESGYAKSASTMVATGETRKTLQFGSANYSPVGATLSLAAEANPIPENATIKSVSVLLNSIQTTTEWSVSVNGTKCAENQTAAKGGATDFCAPIEFADLNLAGNSISLKCEAMETPKKYVNIAQITVTYEVAEVVQVVETPAFSIPTGSVVDNGTEVEVVSATAGASIMCSVNGGDFALSNGVVAISGAQGTKVTLKAYATKEGMTPSDFATAEYTIRRDPVVPPFAEEFAAAESLEPFTIVDAGDDGVTWKYYKTSGCVYIENNMSATAKDDWLITPPLKLTAGVSYAVKFEAKVANASYPERLAVYYGADANAEAMTNELVAPLVLTNTEFEAINAIIKPEADGLYYIGIHACSDKGMYRLFVDNISVAAGIEDLAPGAVADLKVANDATGKNEATITFTTPSETLDGDDLSGITSAVISRNGVEIKTFDNPEPGEEMTYTDAVATAGKYTYTVVCSNDAGAGATAELEAFVGLAAPVAPAEAEVSEPETGKVFIAWNPVTENIYGQPLDASVVSYNIEDASGNQIATGVEDNSYTYTPELEEQALMSFKVYAATAAGSSTATTTARIPVGEPYTMPYAESFKQWHAVSVIEFVGSGSGGYNTWRIMREELSAEILAQDADDGMLVFMPAAVGAEGEVITGKIHVDADAVNPYLSFYVTGDPASGNTLSVEVRPADADPESVPVTFAKGWTEVLVPLSDYAGEDVRIAFVGEAGSTTVSLAIDHISVADIPTVNLAVTRVRIPAEMDYRKAHTVTVDVANTGLRTVDEYTVELLCDGESVAGDEGTTISRGETVRHTFVLTPDHAEAKQYSATVSVSGDVVTEDNTSDSKEAQIIMPIYVPVSELNATADGAGAHLSWKAPEAHANEKAVTETFERYDEFEINKAGEWTFYDVDGGETYGIHNGLHSFPNMTKPMAFIVFNGNIPTLDKIGTMTFDARSGDQFLASFAVRGGAVANDDWLVSPLLNGKAQTISFFARSIAIGNHEEFEVLVSSTDANPSSFKKIGEDEEPYAQWKEFSYDLPEGTRYFAIRCVSLDKYALLIDDITYTPAPTEVGKVLGYDVYRDGEKLNETPVAATSYDDANASDGNHEYEVFAVMPRGVSEGAKVSVATSSLSATLSGGASVGVESGAIVVDAPEAVAVQIADLSGRTIYFNPAAAHAEVAVPAGVYLVAVGTDVVKVIVK